MNTDKLLGMLLEAIDYSFLQIDGSYDKTLTYPVIDKVQYIKEQLKNTEPVSEDLEEAAKEQARSYGYMTEDYEFKENVESFKTGAQWRKKQMMAKAFDAEVLENYDGKVIKYNETILDEKLSDCKVFDKVKVIVIKEE